MAELKRPSRRLYLIAGISLAVIAAGVFLLYIYPTSLENASLADRSVRDSLRVAVVTDANFTDRGWGESSLNAARFIERKYNITVATEDNVAIPDIELTLKSYADSGYDLIIAHGYQWGDPALAVGKTNPEIKIVVFTGLVESRNVASIFPEQQEGSFLLGALAGMMSNTGVIGFVGGEEYPNVVNIFEGYRQGAKWANNNITVIGTYLNDWDNPARGQEAATSIIRRGADLMFHVADSSGKGVIQAASENGVYALGAVQDQYGLAPSAVLSSFVVDVDKAYDSAVRMVMDGNFAGEIFRPGIERSKGDLSGDGIVYLAPFHELEGEVPQSVKDKISELENDIYEGRMEIPERIEADPHGT